VGKPPKKETGPPGFQERRFNFRYLRQVFSYLDVFRTQLLHEY
jgi:hypothetical protein